MVNDQSSNEWTIKECVKAKNQCNQPIRIRLYEYQPYTKYWH